ncbi:MAG: hypothetical protein ACPHL6_12325, partial [Rubripirellula sp.]
VTLFEVNSEGRRPSNGDDPMYHDHQDWQELILFYEYFHADTGRGLGASHQTGWTALVASILESESD